MASYSSDVSDNIGGGYGFGGGMFAMIILLVVVFWVLFRNDGHRDGYGGGYGYGAGFGGCGPCVRPSFLDESNFEEERNINSKLCKIELEQQACCCKEIEATHCEGEKTRALIEQNYIQDLRDKLAAAEMEKLTLKQEMFTEKKFDMVLGAIAKTDRDIDCLKCELPKRPPVFAECITPDTHHIDCDHRGDFRRRGRCDFDDFCCA